MSRLTRREWTALVLGGLAAAPVARLRALEFATRLDSTVAGVRIGAQSYSFRDRDLDAAIAAMKDVGLGFCELWQGHTEPKRFEGTSTGQERREALRKWRLTVPLDEFAKTRRKFDAAGIRLMAYNISFRDDFTDEEIARGFEMARALGVNVITASSNVTTAVRVDPFAQKYGVTVGFHNHSNKAPNEFSGPEDFAAALRGRSNRIAINLDIGHFVAAGHDPLAFLDEHHARIVSLHLKDRKLNDPAANLPFGQGDTPIAAVLQRLRDRHWDIPANIEYEYKGGDTVDEVRRCYAYCRQALTGGTSTGAWRVLFDGSSLDAWRGYKSNSVPDGWKIEARTLTKDHPVEDIVSRDEFGDFELELEWKIGPGGNAGIFYRGTEEYEHIYWSAPEYQLLDDERAPDGKSRLTSAGADYALYPSPPGHLKPVGDWNQTRIVARGAHVEHWLNGVKLLEYELWSADWTAKVAASKFKDYPNYGLAKKGHLALQGDHTGTLAFRNIRIREIQ